MFFFRICQDLEAIKVTYSKRRSECESVLLVLAMVALMIVPWHFLVEPLGASMQEVKAAYCAGHQDCREQCSLFGHS